jgi:glucokinase
LLDSREYVTLDYPSLSAMILTFLGATGVRAQEIEVACVGVAGPNIKQVAKLTNVPWAIDGREVMATTGIRRAWILNDVGPTS